MNECSKSTVPVSSFWFHSLDPLINLPFRKSNQNRLGRFRACRNYRLHPSEIQLSANNHDRFQKWDHKLYEYQFIKNFTALFTVSCEGYQLSTENLHPRCLDKKSRNRFRDFRDFEFRNSRSSWIIHEFEYWVRVFEGWTLQLEVHEIYRVDLDQTRGKAGLRVPPASKIEI